METMMYFFFFCSYRYYFELVIDRLVVMLQKGIYFDKSYKLEPYINTVVDKFVKATKLITVPGNELIKTET